MKILVISSSPNKDGLTAACAAAAAKGIRAMGGEAEEIRLNDLKIDKCHTCNDGWGTCLAEHRCQEEDDFQALHARLAQADGYVLVTPVYWGEMSESAKAFSDRLRRCEATRERGESLLFNKPVIAVAAAGGSGGGMITCLLSMERWIQHVQGRVFDLIPVNCWSRGYKLVAIRAAGRAMAREIQSDKG
ncbi:MAG: flavodoxin family protein [Chloroflexi bacterium]|nr:flavodoxin family protein [Chloroflexota bacterium]